MTDSRFVSSSRAGFSRRTPLAAAVGLASALVGAGALAQDAAELDTLVVQGDWLGNPTEDAVRVYPGARTVIEPEQLHDSGALNLEDAMRSVPGVQVLDETGTGVLPNIGLRGLNPLRSERLKMMLDGYPIAIGPYSNVGVSLFPVTLQSIDTIDVVRGGAAVHYGPNNVGGVVNFLTKPIPGEVTQTLSERVTIAEETGNVFHDTYYRVGGFVSNDLALQFQANLQGGEGFREHADTDVQNFQLDAEYYIDDRHTLDASLQYYEVDADLPGALSPQAYERDRTDSQRPYEAYEADMLRGTLAWTFNPSDDVEFTWRNFAHRADRTFFFGQDLVSGGAWSDPEAESSHVADSPRIFRVWGTEPRLTVREGIHTVTLGARYVNEDVDFDVNRRNLSDDSYTEVRRWDLETDAVALYASDTLSLMDGRLEITPGVRYEDVRMDFRDEVNDTASTNDTDEILPGLTVGFAATDELFLFANAQKSLVPVQIAQATLEGDVANETAWNYELGARVDVTPRLTTSATLFRIDYEDQIQFNKAGDRFVNLGETRHQGIELGTDWQATDRLSLGLGYTYLATEQLTGDNAGNDLPNAPRHHVSANARYEMEQWLASVSVNRVSESYSDALNTRDETVNGDAGELPAYTLVNARIGRDFRLDADTTLNLGLAATNLLDDDAYFRGTDVSPVGRVPMPGRAYMLEARLEF
ncbi:TonB-dependent siderophore receptor [Billgrantia sulfidoxydans]|uniref:TonB-dependent siderophore receptor n=1 Tax=Billgrantia sulfidoxydans TaxID=2733484 RepID=A0ABX7W542_9GAMM|nr:TonB-dependent siderophore receptor [Halomonas sulfidoxydans]QTP54118.1 TonB-dependent siderophore receptor [Halomonas sulfidoxydans]